MTWWKRLVGRRRQVGPPPGHERRLLALAEEVQALVHQQADTLPGDDPEHPFSQEGIADAFEIVREYIEYGEYGLAFDHLGYLMDEGGVALPERHFAELKSLEVVDGL